MAIHANLNSMLYESLIEMYEIAQYSINTIKPIPPWPVSGVYGFPAAILLLSIADTIGAYVTQESSTEKHFRILSNAAYYSPALPENDVELIYDKYRNLVTHNGVVALNATMKIGTIGDPILSKETNGKSVLLLRPFLEATRKALIVFFDQSNELLANNKILRNALLK